MANRPNLTAHSLQAILSNYENFTNLVINKVRFEEGCNPGDNYMSIVKRLYLEGKVQNGLNSQDYKKQIFVKLPFEKTCCNSDNFLFKFESFAFNTVLKELENAISMKLAVPKPIYCTEDIVVLEDLKLEGYILCDRKKGLNTNQATTLIKELAKLHAASIVLKHGNRKLFDVLTAKLRDQLYPNEKNTKWKSSLIEAFDVAKLRINRYCNNCNNNLTNDIRRKIKMFNSLKPEFIFSQAYSSILNTPDIAQVICHGDCWQNNIMLKNENSKDYVILLDMQTLCRSSIARDLIYIFATNSRQLNRNLLTEIYVDKLQKYLKSKEISQQTIDDYNFNLLLSEYARLEYFELLTSIWLLIPISFTTIPSLEEFSRIENLNERTLKLSNCLDNFYDERLIEIICDNNLHQIDEN